MLDFKNAIDNHYIRDIKLDKINYFNILRGVGKFNSKNYESAIDNFNKVIANDKTNYTAYYFRGYQN
ncbi:hypothetical protein FACS1894180_3530 [Bacteroidia bacterium]|nr:hypothetical protein FACS1894180_3530 [Bacteroidia bacterium]